MVTERHSYKIYQNRIEGVITIVPQKTLLKGYKYRQYLLCIWIAIYLLTSLYVQISAHFKMLKVYHHIEDSNQI